MKAPETQIKPRGNSDITPDPVILFSLALTIIEAAFWLCLLRCSLSVLLLYFYEAEASSWNPLVTCTFIYIYIYLTEVASLERVEQAVATVVRVGLTSCLQSRVYLQTTTTHTHTHSNPTTFYNLLLVLTLACQSSTITKWLLTTDALVSLPTPLLLWLSCATTYKPPAI